MPVRKVMIDIFLSDLIQSLGKVRSPVSPQELKTLYEQGSYTEMASVIKRSIRLELRLRIGYIKNSDKPIGFSRVEFIGTTQATLYVYREFLRQATFEFAVCFFAYHISRILLNTLQNTHKDSGEAAEVAAMVLGYRDYFKAASARLSQVEEEVTGYMPKEFNDIFRQMIEKTKQMEKLSAMPYHLTNEEIAYTIEQIEQLD